VSTPPQWGRREQHDGEIVGLAGPRQSVGQTHDLLIVDVMTGAAV
jgi:hypothetical protein